MVGGVGRGMQVFGLLSLLDRMLYHCSFGPGFDLMQDHYGSIPGRRNHLR